MARIDSIAAALGVAFPDASVEIVDALVFVSRANTMLSVFVDDDGHRVDDDGDTSSRLHALYDAEGEWSRDALDVLKHHGVTADGRANCVLSVDTNDFDATISVRRLLNAIAGLEALDRKARARAARRAVA